MKIYLFRNNFEFSEQYLQNLIRSVVLSLKFISDLTGNHIFKSNRTSMLPLPVINTRLLEPAATSVSTLLLTRAP